MDQKDLSRNLSRIMEEQGKSKSDLSFDSRIAYANIDSILRGKTVDPRVSTLKALSKALGVTVDELIAGTEQVEQQTAV